MKLAKSNQVGRITWRSRLAGLLGLGLALTAAACTGSSGTATSPSGVSPASLAVAGGAVKNFSVTISPTSLPVGAGSLTVTVTNDLTTNPTTLQLGSVQIVVPAGLTVTSVGTFSGSKTWSSLWTTGQTVLVGATSGTQKLSPGQSVTFQIGVTSSICQNNAFANPAGSSATPGSFSPDWTYTGAALSVSVTGCSTECPAAPAVSNAYLDSIGFTGSRGAIDSAVAQHMTQGAYFDGINPCDLQAYHDAVVTFVRALLPK